MLISIFKSVIMVVDSQMVSHHRHFCLVPNINICKFKTRDDDGYGQIVNEIA